ncbi:alpha/beta fold hydrolase [Streptomyces lomondensis]|uniref:AB hydrolase-1 domain-containing protein n=1 Tax=Streptomyces lomondensis TaxID=68229 RepID=A0ABQ2XF42_9ACTN|nr:hypothetical protein GCM10010383_50050 [Streptomyces lomondensis]
MPRLAKDLFDLLEALDLREVTVLGWSLGCPVIWSYLELFGSHRLARAVYVQQAPRQYYAPDWPHAHATCYDEPSLAALRTQLTCDTPAFDEEQIRTVFATEPTPPERELLLTEMAKAPTYARNALMTDHTRHDWRDLLPTIRLPGWSWSHVRTRCSPGRAPPGSVRRCRTPGRSSSSRAATRCSSTSRRSSTGRSPAS